jgi:predicted AAA+ superfamily ATPase
MIQRLIYKRLVAKLKDEKALIILGPRQVGKTSLLHQIEKELVPPVLWLNGDEADTRALLSNPTSTSLKAIIGQAKTLIIDEAQRIENIGLCMKLVTDQIKQVKLVVTGSSSFELANKINEPLTGRKWEFQLYPFSYYEMAQATSAIEERRLLEHRLVFGYYPEIILHPGEEAERLKELSQSYLYKDILTWERIQKPDKLEKLVQALAFQVGNQVSYTELGQLCGLDNETTEKYIGLLEKAFIVFRLGALSRNLRNELKKSRKIYFFDNGLRNAVINQFSPAGLRQDIGALWENFLMSERLKTISYANIHCNRYFWRTVAQQEIDYIEESDGQMQAYEFKWNEHSKTKIPSSFLNAYPGSQGQVITKENFESFLMP